MTKDETSQFKHDLLTLREELQELEQEFSKSGSTVVLDQSSVGRLSRMDAMQAQQMALETSRRRQLHAQKIEGALKRIESGEFGYCYVCEEEIDPRRLQADPSNTRCLKCAEKE
jgi:DnaK suppressor protein